MNTSDGLVRQNFDPGQARLVLDLDVLTSASNITHADPTSNRVLPADDRVSQEREWLDNCLP